MKLYEPSCGLCDQEKYGQKRLDVGLHFLVIHIFISCNSYIIKWIQFEILDKNTFACKGKSKSKSESENKNKSKSKSKRMEQTYSIF